MQFLYLAASLQNEMISYCPGGREEKVAIITEQFAFQKEKDYFIIFFF